MKVPITTLLIHRDLSDIGDKHPEYLSEQDKQAYIDSQRSVILAHPDYNAMFTYHIDLGYWGEDFMYNRFTVIAKPVFVTID